VKKVVFSILTIFAIWSLLGNSQELSNNLIELKTKLIQELKAGTCISTLALARKIYLLDPKDLRALETIAECTQADNDIHNYASGAKEIFEQSRILSIVPHILEMAQVKELVPILKEVEVKKDKSLNDYLMLNEIYERLGEPEKQISALKEAIQSAPGDPRPLLLLAAKKLDAGEKEEALGIFRNYLSLSNPHPGQIYLMAYVFALIYPLSSAIGLLLLIWLSAYFLIYHQNKGKNESYEIKIGISTILFIIPSLLAFRFWQSGKALPFGALLVIFLIEVFLLAKPTLRKIYAPLFRLINRIIFFVFNGILLARKLDALPSGSRVFIALITLTVLGTIAPTIEIPDLRYAVTIFSAFLFYATLGSLLVSFLRSRTSLLLSLRWIAIAATLPFLISYLISNWNSLGSPLLYARLPATKAIDSLFNYLVFWGVSLFLSLHLSKIIAQALVEPIQEIIKKVARIEKGELTAKVNVFSKDEIGSLGQAINRMGNGLERREKIEKIFHKYIDKQIADRILEGCETEVRIEGRKTHAVVLFADIRGYTSMSENIPVQEIVKILNDYFERMVKVVQKHEGVVDKFIGDNLMAVWGVPYEKFRAEEKAVKAALEMLKEIETWNQELEKQGSPTLAIGIGLNAGTVIAGSLGSSDHMEYTVIGDVVNSAQRAESIAKGNELLITDSVYDKIKHLVVATPLDPIKVKGKEIIQNYWSVTELKDTFEATKDLSQAS
jgi:class 3 adenylate cyclase